MPNTPAAIDWTDVSARVATEAAPQELHRLKEANKIPSGHGFKEIFLYNTRTLLPTGQDMNLRDFIPAFVQTQQDDARQKFSPSTLKKDAEWAADQGWNKLEEASTHGGAPGSKEIYLYDSKEDYIQKTIAALTTSGNEQKLIEVHEERHKAKHKLGAALGGKAAASSDIGVPEEASYANVTAPTTQVSKHRTPGQGGHLV